MSSRRRDCDLERSRPALDSRPGIRELADRHPAIGDVRGLGLFIGVALVDDRELRGPATDLAAAVVEGAKDREICSAPTGPITTS